MSSSPDVVIIGSGIGGGTLANCLVRHGLTVTILERGLGSDPSKAALNEFCRSFDHENLFVVDASFFPSSAAVNPALTIVAQAIRVADHMAKVEVDFGVTLTGAQRSANSWL